MLMHDVMPRSAIPEEYTWDLSTLYPSLQAWQDAFDRIMEQATPPYFPQLAVYKGSLSDPNKLKATLDHLFALERSLDKLFTYAHLRHDEETSVNEAKSALQKITMLSHELQQEAAWISPQLVSLPETTLQRLIGHPVLQTYRFFLEQILRDKPHTLSEEQETIVSLAMRALGTPVQAFSSLNNTDLQFDPIVNSQGERREVTHGLYQVYLRDSDRVLRKNAFQSVYRAYHKVKNTMSDLLQGEVQTDLFVARSHHYSSCLEAALYPQNINLAVYHNLITTTHQHLSVLHRYMDFKRRMLKLDTLHAYDLYAPIYKESSAHFSYQEAKDLVIASVAPLGAEYQQILTRGLQEQRWVDLYENQNKRSGAYSNGCFDSYPYILMNYRGTLRDVFTLAHEAGHSMHSFYSRQSQPYHLAKYPIFIAEVASTLNEELLTHELLKRLTSKEEKISILCEKLEDIRTTFFRQVMFAEFELKIHEYAEQNKPLTSQTLEEIYLQLNRDYLGPSVTLDDELAMEWARVPHFYYNFYVYQYATGISASLFLMDHLIHQPQAVNQYLQFLQSGGSAYPLDLLRKAGVNMEAPEPIIQTIQHFEELLNELESLLDSRPS